MPNLESNISLVRANTNTTAFDSGVINENTVYAYANLFYPYISDNGGQKEISLTIDVMNRDELEKDTKDLINKQWVSKDRLANTLSNLKPIWGFKEAYHGIKKSRAISNAFCFGGQNLTFYIAPKGHETGYVDNEWYYCKTTITIKAVDVINGTNSILYVFDDFESNKEDTSRYFNWIVPSINQDAFDEYGLFGLCVISIEIDRVYYEDAEWTTVTDKIIPSKNQSNLQLLIYSGAKEIIEVDVGDADILDSIPSYDDTLEQIFNKTIFKNLESLNQNALTNSQKAAIIADQIAVIFMSQHPVISADFYPGKVIGFGASQSIPPRKIVNKAITYGKRYPEIIPLVKDRLYGMFAIYKAFNFWFDIEAFVSDFEQSTQIIKDPVKFIYIDGDGNTQDDFGINGIAFNPYILSTTNVESIGDVFSSIPIDVPLYDGVVNIQNIEITDAFGFKLAPYAKYIKVSFDVVFGSDYIDQIKYSIFTKNSLNYQTYVERDGSNRFHVFGLEGDAISDPFFDVDVIHAQIDVKDKFGGITSFMASEIGDGYTERPSLSDLKFYQRNDGSEVVDIYYTYKGVEEINNANVEVNFSTDNGVSWSNVAATSLKGDFGSGIMPGLRRVTWLPNVDIKDTSKNTVLCKITLTDADKMAGVGEILTGALVMDLEKPEIAVIRSPL